MNELTRQFGAIDIYVFDQLLRGRIPAGSRILDAGCGYGRNLVYFLQNGYEVFGVDRDADAVAAFGNPERFRNEPIEAMSFPDASFDVVLASAVLHFARDEAHFGAMMREIWRVLHPKGLFFARLASNIGMPDLPSGRCRLPDGSERFVISEQGLLSWTRNLGAELADPIKTTLVGHERAMTTWVLRKPVLPG